MWILAFAGSDGNALRMDETLLDTLPVAHRLALSYAPLVRRDDTLALFALNERLAGIVRQDGEPVIAQMKLAWWRDRLGDNPANWPVGEPLLALLQQWAGDVSQLVALVDGWENLLVDSLSAAELHDFSEGHAQAWQALSGSSDATIAPAARQWALAHLSMHLGDQQERDLALAHLQPAMTVAGRIPRSVRPLAVLRALAFRAVRNNTNELLDGPGAMGLAIRVGIVGR